MSFGGQARFTEDAERLQVGNASRTSRGAFVTKRRRWAVASNTFSGTAYVLGRKTTGLDSDSSKPWVKCDVTTGAAVEAAGPPADPWPANERWREKAYVSGDIYVDA